MPDETPQITGFAVGAAITAAALPVMSNPIPYTSGMLIEGVWTSDGRYINPGAIVPRETPLTLLAMTKTADGHDGAEVCGRIDSIIRLPGDEAGSQILTAVGAFDGTSAIGLESARLVREQILRGVSADMSVSDVEFGQSDAGLDTMTVLAGEILAATVCPTPAFAGCTITLDQPALVPALAASGAPEILLVEPTEPWRSVGSDECVPCTEARESVTASAIPTAPPADWFADPKFDGPTALTITDDGRVFGHLATWGTCHTGFEGQCVLAPRSYTNYGGFRLGCVQCHDGTVVATGPITMGTGHAPITASWQVAVEHYDNTGTGAADVAAGEDAFGIWVAGALRPDMTPERVRILRASPLSGDWRRRGAGLELLAALAVNTPGFPIARVASGAQLALVAAGVVQDRPDVITELRDELAALRRERQAQRLHACIHSH